MEKFMYLFIDGPSPATPPSAEQMQAGMQKWFAWIEKLRKQDRYVSGEPLLPEGKLIKGAKKIITDGPFAESKELVSGYFVVNANDIEEATKIAMDCPILDVDGSVIVRPVRKVDM